MSIRFRIIADDRGVRLLGALIGLAIGTLTVLPSIVTSQPVFPDRPTGLLVLFFGPVLGWAFAVGAAKPGVRSAVRAAVKITFIAVPIGALLVGAAFGVNAGAGPSELIAGTIGIAFVGLLFLGIPLAMLTFVVASVWVGALRVAIHVLDRGSISRRVPT